MEKQYTIGVQTFGLSTELQEDFDGCIAKLYELGFTALEPLLIPAKQQGRLPYNLWSQELLLRGVAAAKANGMRIPSAHVSVGSGGFRLPKARLIRDLRTIMELTDIRVFVFSGMFSDDRAAKAWGDYLGSVAEALSDTDAQILYHNHEGEFKSLVTDGRLHYPLDTFLAAAGERVKLQFDFGWAAFAGDELALFARYRDRIVSLHCKDFRSGVCRSTLRRERLHETDFAAIGAGEVRTEEIIPAYLALPDTTGAILIDQDKCAGDRFDDLRIGFENIKRCARQSAKALDGEGERPFPSAVTLEKSRLSLMTFSLAPELMTGKLKTADTLCLAAEAGVSFVDLMNISAGSIPGYLSAMAATGVSVNCYIASISFFSSDEKLRKTLEREMGIADALRARFFMIVPYALPTELLKAKKLGKERVREHLITGFRTAVEEGKRRGLTVCFETTPHDELALSSSEDCAAVLNAVEDLGLVFDTANMLPAGEPPLQSYERLKDRICYVHLKDVLLTRGGSRFFDELTADGRRMHCCLWGEGEIPLTELYERMLRDGYTGRFAIEYARPSGLKGYEEHLEQLQAHFRHG